jgi:hypothetical protein
VVTVSILSPTHHVTRDDTRNGKEFTRLDKLFHYGYQDRIQLVPDAPGHPGVRDHRERSEHATPDSLVVNGVDEVVNDRVDRRC